MEYSSNADTSFSSLDPISSKEEDLFSTSLISSTTSDGETISTKPVTWEVADFATDVYVPNPPCSSPKMYASLPEKLRTRKSKILPSSLLLSVTKKVRDGTVSKSEISPNDLKARTTTLAPGFHKVKDDPSSCKLLPPMSPPTIKSFINKSPSTHFLDSNIISNVDCNMSPLAFFLKAEVTGDVEDDKLGSSVNSDTSICTIYSDDETRNKLRAERPTKQIPNYFISIQFSDPEIYGSLKEVHKSIMKKNGNCSLAAVPLHSLHMTLAVMRLDSEEDMIRARSALNRCGDELRPKYRHKLLELPLQGLGNFRHSVVFAKVHPGEHVSKLEEIAAVVQRRFCEEGLVDNKYDFTPHVTVLKLSRVGKKLTKKTGLKKIYPDIYEEFEDSYFGTQKVHDLQLCSMLKAKDISGYYQVEHRIEFGVDDDSGTTIPVVNDGTCKNDSSSLTPVPIDSATKQSNQEPIVSTSSENFSSEINSPTICENKEFDSVLPNEASKNNTYSYKSEMFMYIPGQKVEHALSEEFIQDVKESHLVTTELINKPMKTVKNTNYSAAINLPLSETSTPIDKQISDSKFTSIEMCFSKNLHLTDKPVSENMPPSDKPVSDTSDRSVSSGNFSSITINLSEYIPPSNNLESDKNFSSRAVNLSKNLPSTDEQVSENIPSCDKSMSDNVYTVVANLSENIPSIDKAVSDPNFSPVAINLSENIPSSDKPLSDPNFSPVAINLSENIPSSDKPLSDPNFSPVAINLSENSIDKPLSDPNFSPVAVNLSENIPSSDKPLSDPNFSPVAVNLSENIPSSDKPLSDPNFSPVAINLSENTPSIDKPVSDPNFSPVAVNLSEEIPSSDKPMYGSISSVTVNFLARMLPSDETLSEANISSIGINLPENISSVDKAVSDTNSSSPVANLSVSASADDRSDLKLEPSRDIFGEKISENNKADLPDYSGNSLNDAPLSDTVSARADLYSNEIVPTLMVNQAESIVDESSTRNVINVDDSRGNSNLHLKETLSSSSMTISTTVTFQTPVMSQDVSLTGNTIVSDVSIMEEPMSSVIVPISCPLSLDDLEFAEEATEGLSSVCNNPEADGLIQNETADACSIASKTSDGNSLNTVPSMPKKRRKMGKCSIM